MLLFQKARKCGGPLVGPTAANVENYVAWLEECLSHVEFACNTMFPLLQIMNKKSSLLIQKKQKKLTSLLHSIILICSLYFAMFCIVAMSF